MAAKPRSEVYNPGEQAVVHVMNRCVRGQYLMGYDKDTKKDNSHRRSNFEAELKKATAGFAIDLLAQAIMSNHFHLILRSRPEIVQQWTDQQVVARWHGLCPIFKDKHGFPRNPSSEDLDAKCQDTKLVAEYRCRLSDISWFMKLVQQRFAKRCHSEDGKPGKVWNGRFKCKLLLDERALIACCAYVDLNHIKAELSDSLETSDFTSIQRRLQTRVIQPAMRLAMAEDLNLDPDLNSKAALVDTTVSDIPDAKTNATANAMSLAIATVENSASNLPDAHLSPIHIDEKNDPIGPQISHNGARCSDKGFLPHTEDLYIELLRWSANQIVCRKHEPGHEPPQPFDDSLPPVLQGYQFDADTWYKLVTQFPEMFYLAAGMPETVDSYRSVTGKRFNMPDEARELLTLVYE